MSTHPNAPDAAVDELKRRARRRLMGAIVLALAAAVILPMLLESDPKPLGNDVSIQIPPVDSGKFITPLSPDAAPAARPKAEAATTTTATTATPAAPGPDLARTRTMAASEQRVLGQPAPTVMPSAPEAMRPVAKSAPAVPSEKPASAKANNPASTAAAPADATGLYVVQVAALADVAAAADMAAKLNAAGFSARVEPVATSQGSIQRVRVGAYSSHDSANEALAKIKSAGYGGAIVTSK